MENVIALIAKERKRQIEKEGYSLAHDDSHTGGELALAAAIYATPHILYEHENKFVNQITFRVANMKDYSWQLDLPFNGNVQQHNYMLNKDRRLSQLVKAGALIVAEIERLQRGNY